MNTMLTALLVWWWNVLVRHSSPFEYVHVSTGNNHITHTQNEKTQEGYVFEVIQLKVSRRPRTLFRSRTVYQYRVTRHYFHKEKFVRSQSDVMPEFCSFLFRNTKVPHVLAVNAFLKIYEK